MRKVLLLNGSHKSGKSYTMIIAEQFASGLVEHDPETVIETVDLIQQNINACTGCHTCWTTTPGECVFQDDMTELFHQYEDADIVIWATPLYHYGISSAMKKFMERTQPALLPFIDNEGGGTYGHPFRNPEKMLTKKHVLISTCGFPSTKNNYEGVEEQFNNLFGKDKWEKIICVEGELLGIHQLDNLTGPYLDLVKIAGQEYGENLTITPKVREGLSKPFVETPTYLQTTNLSWGVDDTRMKDSDGGLIAWNYMKEVQAAFNPKVRPKMNAVLQIDFTDIKERYQFVIKDETCTLLRNDFARETATININLTTLERILEGKIDAAQSLLEKKYSVVGDMRLFNAFLDGLFGPVNLNPDKKKRLVPISFKNTPYWFFLALCPWIFCFLFADYSPLIGVVIPLMISGILCGIKRGTDLVYFERATLLTFSLLGLMVVTFGSDYPGNTFAIIGYFALALIWAISTLKTIPLTADYTHYFNGRNALKNVLFLRTNRLLCYVWSLVFLAQAGLALWLNTTLLINFAAILPIILSIPTFVFSLWFLKWHPSDMAKPK
ncbi:NAD(P)H-dependent oxidoreductase [Acetobacterium malicum]|uniref:NAD(P)H-dependent oxidoreductase n=1 Tax=Acetobacterium malicum TaxID=52692 RepID=UPI003593E66F